MTNLEWLRSLSEEEFADWLYGEWLRHLQYRWSSSRGGLIIWLKAERMTEPQQVTSKLASAEIPTVLDYESTKQQVKDRVCGKDINVRSKDEPQTEREGE